MDIKFTDLPNKTELKQQFMKLQDELQMWNFVEETFPGWIHKVIYKYSKDYPHLTNNWNKICELLQTKPQRIILVSWISGDPDHQLTRDFAEILTKKGYIVRRADEFIQCKLCNSAIPDKELWTKMKEHKLPCPDKWSYICTNC